MQTKFTTVTPNKGGEKEGEEQEEGDDDDEPIDLPQSAHFQSAEKTRPLSSFLETKKAASPRVSTQSQQASRRKSMERIAAAHRVTETGSLFKVAAKRTVSAAKFAQKGDVFRVYKVTGPFFVGREQQNLRSGSMGGSLTQFWAPIASVEGSAKFLEAQAVAEAGRSVLKQCISLKGKN